MLAPAFIMMPSLDLTRAVVFKASGRQHGLGAPQRATMWQHNHIAHDQTHPTPELGMNFSANLISHVAGCRVFAAMRFAAPTMPSSVYYKGVLGDPHNCSWSQTMGYNMWVFTFDSWD